MTAIVGIVDKKVWLGGDSAATSEYSVNVRADPKVFKNGKFVFGYSGSFRSGQILQYELVPPEVDEVDMKFMVSKFVPVVKRLLANEDSLDFLVGFGNQLFQIEDDFQVARVSTGYYASGTGADLALGSLHTSHQYRITVRDRIKLALSAAACFNTSVREPFHIVST